jgi:hypothetical protein
LTGYNATRRDIFAIKVANWWLRLIASRYCNALLHEVYQRGLRPDPLGSPINDPCDYSGLFDYGDEDDDR